MDLVKQFREYTRQLECHLDNMTNVDCCCCGVNKAQCFLLVEIGRKPGISAKELSVILQIDKSVVSRLVEDLVRKEYVERKPSPEDRRFITLNLLPKGQERFEKIEHDMYYEFKKVLEEIPKDKREQVVESLRLYNEACSAVEEQNND